MIECSGNFLINRDNECYLAGEIDQLYECHGFDYDYYYGCRALWRAMIMQAIVDSISEHKRTEYRMAKINAIEWLRGNSNNFKLVCYLAGYSADLVAKKSTELVRANKVGNKRIKSLHYLDAISV